MDQNTPALDRFWTTTSDQVAKEELDHSSKKESNQGSHENGEAN
jgi:hypothetical protein